MAGVIAVSASARAANPSANECVDANEEAQGLRRDGRLRASREKLRLCVAPSCPGPVREDCAERLRDIEAALPSVVFQVVDERGNDVSGVRVTMDGSVVAERLDGNGLEVDPGEHTFAFEAPQARARKTLVARAGDKGRREIVRLVAPRAPGVTSGAEESRERGAAQRTAGWLVGGAGLLAVVVGGVFGVRAKATYDDARSAHCPGGSGSCDAAGIDGGRDAHDQARVATIAMVLGGAALAAGAVLVLTAPRDAVQVSVGTRRGVASVGVAWPW